MIVEKFSAKRLVILYAHGIEEVARTKEYIPRSTEG